MHFHSKTSFVEYLYVPSDYSQKLKGTIRMFQKLKRTIRISILRETWNEGI